LYPRAPSLPLLYLQRRTSNVVITVDELTSVEAHYPPFKMVVLSTTSEDRASAATHSSDVPAPSGLKTSEKRRAQNRAAQKTYREKRKRKLQELERLAASAGLISPPESEGYSPQSGKDHPSSSVSASEEPPAVNVVIKSASSDPLLANVGEIFDFDAIVDPSWLTEDVQDDSSTATPLTTDSPEQSDGAATQLSHPMSLVTKRSTPLYPYMPAQELANTLATRNSIEFADPLMNTLRLQKTNLWMAFYQNVFQLGHTDLTCAEDIISPFYRSDLRLSSDPDSIVKSVQTTFSSMKRDLRPTKEQITISHPAYIDALPFPQMRSRIIELSSHEPPLINDDELWDDLENGGLTCWGSISVRPGVAPSGGGAPWDSRSWEAKTWFLAKWSFIIGGDDSDLSRSSEWWREMRGVGQGFSF
jgi:hypothetical protein